MKAMEDVKIMRQAETRIFFDRIGGCCGWCEGNKVNLYGIGIPFAHLDIIQRNSI
jgi:hypothetical protein